MFIKLDSLRFKINLSNSFGTLEGALIPQDNVMYCFRVGL